MTNVRKILEDRVRRDADKAFLRFANRSFNYTEFDEQVNRVANALYELGVRKGEHIGGLMHNCLEWFILYFAAIKLGAITVFVNTQYDSELLQHSLGFSDCRVIILSASLARKYQSVRAGLKGIRLEIVHQDDPSIDPGIVEGMIPFGQLYTGSSKPPPDAGIEAKDPVHFFYTSGTTGLPKPCIVSHHYMIALCDHIAGEAGMTEKDTLFALLPNYHINVYIGVMTALIVGSRLALEARFSASRYWDWVRHYGASVLMLHITPMNILLKQPPKPDDAVNPARVGIFLVGAGGREFLRRFGLQRGLAMYGSTEAGGFCTMSSYPPDSTHDPRFAGKARDDMEVKIFDEHDREVPYGQPGEIVIRDRLPHAMFDGYYKMPEKTADACRGFWFRSGDRGYMDERGNLFFMERLGESIRVKGDFVPVDRLEECVRAHPKVFQCAAVGVPSDLGEEDIKLYVQVHPGVKALPEEIVHHCRQHLAPFMVPRYLEFVEEFPLATGVMKIQKAKLKKKGIGNAWDRLKSQQAP